MRAARRALGDLGAATRDTAQASCRSMAMMAGADFVKASTGKESVNATLQVDLAMGARFAISRRPATVGFKPAGGISTANRRSTGWC